MLNNMWLHSAVYARQFVSCVAVLISCATANAGQPLDSISLASPEWRFQMDPDDVGTSESWWQRELTGTIQLPGSMTENGLGNEITSSTPWTQHQPRLDELLAQPKLAKYLKPGNVKVPFWLTPVKYYKGAAWYQLDIYIPSTWVGRPSELYLERPHWRTDVWVDNDYLGKRDSLSVPHRYSLVDLSPGRHRLTIRVDNRMQVDVGLNAHSVTDHTQTNWNGIVGNIELRPDSAPGLRKIAVFPSVEDNSVHVVSTLEGTTTSETSEGNLQIEIRPKDEPGKIVASISTPIQFEQGKWSVDKTLKLDQPARLWDEFSPNLYEVHVVVTPNEPSDLKITATEIFGFRDFVTSGTEFVVNGRPTFLRGTLECCIFPLTGYPPMEVEPWRRIMRVIQEHGLNHIRFHSWCPPEAAFDAADEAGVYLSVECASWAKPGQDPDYDEWLYAESQRIVNEYANHPSFCMLLYGNEPGGDKKKYRDFLNEFVADWDRQDSRFLVSGGAGWPALENNEFHILQEPRIQQWGEGLKSRVNSKPPETVTDYEDFIEKHKIPVISHEIGQWCVYPNLDERRKYTGVTRALNFDIFEDSLIQNHMRDQADDFLMASGKLQALLYKEDIESALRTKGMGGFQLLDLHDFPGQGTALVGVLDPFWDSKGYISAEEYRQFTGPVVPLANLPKRVYTNDEVLTCAVELANYGKSPLTGSAFQWELISGADIIANGEFDKKELPLGNGIELGEIVQPLNTINKAERLSLRVFLAGSDISNSWNIWVYPAEINTAPPPEVLLTKILNAAALKRLEDGGKVLLIPNPDRIKGDSNGRIKSGFSSIFWNTAWTGGQAPHTLGILCDPEHAALSAFPTDSHTDWQWWYLVHKSPVMLLDGLAPEFRPIVQMIDDWTTNRRLGFLFECRYNGGKLMVCSMQLGTDDPVSRQMLKSIFDYMKSNNFDPESELTPAELYSVLKKS